MSCWWAREVSEFSGVKAGTTSVPPGPRASSSASRTVSGAAPVPLRDACTMSTPPRGRPPLRTRLAALPGQPRDSPASARSSLTRAAPVSVSSRAAGPASSSRAYSARAPSPCASASTASVSRLPARVPGTWRSVARRRLASRRETAQPGQGVGDVGRCRVECHTEGAGSVGVEPYSGTRGERGDGVGAQGVGSVGPPGVLLGQEAVGLAQLFREGGQRGELQGLGHLGVEAVAPRVGVVDEHLLASRHVHVNRRPPPGGGGIALDLDPVAVRQGDGEPCTVHLRLDACRGGQVQRAERRQVQHATVMEPDRRRDERAWTAAATATDATRAVSSAPTGACASAARTWLWASTRSR